MHDATINILHLVHKVHIYIYIYIFYMSLRKTVVISPCNINRDGMCSFCSRSWFGPLNIIQVNFGLQSWRADSPTSQLGCTKTVRQ